MFIRLLILLGAACCGPDKVINRTCVSRTTQTFVFDVMRKGCVVHRPTNS